MNITSRKLEKILEPYINDNLECDGQSKVISYILIKNDIDHKLYDGELVNKKSGEGIYHQWIEINNNLIADYKAKMWYPDSDCWHGIFEKSKMNDKDLKYTQPKSMGMPKISDIVFKILCNEGKTMKLAEAVKKLLKEDKYQNILKVLDKYFTLEEHDKVDEIKISYANEDIGILDIIKMKLTVTNETGIEYKADYPRGQFPHEYFDRDLFERIFAKLGIKILDEHGEPWDE